MNEERKPVQSWKEAYDNIQDDECKVGIACAVFIPLAIVLIISSFAGCTAAKSIWGQQPVVKVQPKTKPDPIAERILAVKSSVYDANKRDEMIQQLVEQGKDFFPTAEWDEPEPPAGQTSADPPTEVKKKGDWQ